MTVTGRAKKTSSSATRRSKASKKKLGSVTLGWTSIDVSLMNLAPKLEISKQTWEGPGVILLSSRQLESYLALLSPDSTFDDGADNSKKNSRKKT
jgi:hypothetical protein